MVHIDLNVRECAFIVKVWLAQSDLMVAGTPSVESINKGVNVYLAILCFDMHYN